MADESGERPYWASESDIKKLAPRVLERFQWWMDLLRRSGRLASMRSMLGAYYGVGVDEQRDSGRLRETGVDGEVTEMHVNQVRPIITNALSLIAGTDPAVKARARNGDAKTLAQTRLAEALLEAYDSATSSKELEIDVVRGGLIASLWSLGQSWAPKDGKEWTRDEKGAPVYEGDVNLFKLAPWHTFSDFAATDESQRKWTVLHRPLGRYDTAAQFEEAGDEESLAIAQRIRKHDVSVIPSKYGTDAGGTAQLDVLLGESLPTEDVVWVWELRHLPTPALPEGRLVRFIEPDILLWDSLGQGVKYPYQELHVYEFAPERVVSGAGSHTGAFDLGALQEFVDVCTASIATTVNINGQMHLWAKTGSGVQTYALKSGNTVVESPEEPKPLEFPALKPEVVAAAEWAIEQARQAMALNNVVMGQPDKGMPASAQALQRAQAMQYHAVAQGERVRLRARNANGKLKLLKRFARASRTTELAGKARAYEMKEWKSEDISDVERFDVEPINPMSATFEGRQSMLELLMKMGTIRDGDAALTFLQTGSLATVTATQTALRELVEANVALLQKGIGPPPVDMAKQMPALQAAMAAGQPPPAPIFAEVPEGQEVLRIYKSDPHHLAIPAYLGVLSSPASRGDAQMVKACQEAILLSLEFWKALEPDEAAAFGIPPLPSQLAAAGMGPPPPPGAPGETPPGEDMAPPPIDEAPDLPAPPESPLDGAQEPSSELGLPQ